jgi:hypothetical protein
MRVNGGASNRLRCSPYAPLYDPARFFTRQRCRSIWLLALEREGRALLSRALLEARVAGAPHSALWV